MHTNTARTYTARAPIDTRNRSAPFFRSFSFRSADYELFRLSYMSRFDDEHENILYETHLSYG